MFYFLYRLRLALNPLALVILFLTIGPLVLGTGIYNYMSSKRLADKCTAITVGVVVNVEEEDAGRYRDSGYIAVVEPDDGSIFNYTTLRSALTDHVYQEGERVVIKYDPSDSSTYFIQYAEFVSDGMITIIVGAFLTVFGLGVLVLYKKMKKRDNLLASLGRD